MSDGDDKSHRDEMTLDPPGSIAVVGAGVLGVEASLYGRFLGYNVTLIEASEVGHSLRERCQDPLPILPHRCLSPLAASALESQRQAARATDREATLPTTCEQWIEDVLVPLTESDLLRGRLRCPVQVTKIVPIEVDDDGGGEASEIPPDFRLTLVDAQGGEERLDVEAVILAVGQQCEIRLGFESPAEYFWQIGSTAPVDAEQHLAGGLREIVGIFAQLGGRADLDLYRPRRG